MRVRQATQRYGRAGMSHANSISPFRTGRRRDGGFSLLTALFLLVVVSGLAAYMVNLATAQHLSSALTVQNSRAYFAALSGLEWTADQVRNNPAACPAVPTGFSADGFMIRLVACTRSVITEAGSTYALFDVTVDANRGAFGDWDFVSRSIRATLSE